MPTDGSANWVDEAILEEGAAAQALHSQVADIVEMAQVASWHISFPVGSQVDQACSWKSGLGANSTDPLNALQEDSAAILLLTELADLQQSCDLLSSMCAGNRHLPPLVVVLISTEGVPCDPTQVLEAQRRLLVNGAEEVLWKVGGKLETKLLVSMAVAKIWESRKGVRNLEQQLRQAYDLEVCKLREQEDMRVEPNDGLFWQAVHRTFEGFPPLRRDVEPWPAVGSKMGTCQLEAILGTGTFGTVFAASDIESGEMQAVKQIEKASLVEVDDVINLWKEMRFLKRLRHDNIVTMHGALHGPNHIFIAMERAGRCTLFRFMKSSKECVTVEVSQRVQAQLSSAVAHCHSRGVAHRDLKPENICISDCRSQIKVLDFGSATCVDKLARDLAGTMPFMAPEVMCASHEAPYSPAPADVWSCGVILLELLCGIGRMDRLLGWDRRRTPCEARGKEVETSFADHSGLLKAVGMDVHRPCKELVRLICGMLEVDPEHRWNASQVEYSTWVQAAARCADC